ncbi:BtpA/SgcQ family protein [Halomarina litorea]|uniref:BtpA/SgcQ family protein n=1 Tax=Halomarina litorea TaxID=2961595 RepID=UPI0020C5689D|nr:BtpA/SgcQ family protein [Halomarina sp. BCD28]
MFDTCEGLLVGMVHLPTLPGAPGYEGSRTGLRDRAVADARALESGGMDALLVENFGDAPFYPDDVPDHTVAEMTAVVGAVRDAVSLPVGVNVLRNDARAALSVAAATGGAMVRVNVHAGARVTDQGVVEGRAHETMRLRDRLDCDVSVLADVAVKHSSPLGEENVESETRDVVERGHADAVVVSGRGTAEPTNADRLSRVARVAAELDVPVLAGSGVTPETVWEVLSVADGAIVGSALKEGGAPTNPVDEARVRALVTAARG